MSVDNEKEQLIQNDPNELKLPDVDTTNNNDDTNKNGKKPAPKSKLVNGKDEHPDEKHLKVMFFFISQVVVSHYVKFKYSRY